MNPDLSYPSVPNSSERQRRNYLINHRNRYHNFPHVNEPYILRLYKKQKAAYFLIQDRTFSRSKNLIVTDNKGEEVLFLVQFHPLSPDGQPTDENGWKLARMIQDLYSMSQNLPHIPNKWTLNGKMSCIGFKGATESGKTAGKWYPVVFI